ncbi:865_t:CDS:2 [Cetraspora pellucida]|uniref:865_t:CDS:1 n=1 Tax=Cetraspora pellucida TaxID=1433469 RepID=A0A9N8VS68_9GLOM|nr:865_t:CDS:2 [Cetraspora pellucida]
MSESRFFTQQDGSKIAYKIFEPENIKNEVPLIMIMGFAGTKEIFLGFEEELAKNQTVLIFDNRGIGESTVASYDDPITIELMAQDTIELIRHLEIKRFNLFGGSMGGNIALCIALNVPSDIKLEKLIIGATFARIRPDLKLYQSLERLYKLPNMGHPKTIQEQKDILLKSDKDIVNYQLKHPDKFDKIAEIIFDIVSRLQEIKVPTLIIHGEIDDVVPIGEGELLAREIPNAQFYKIPKTGHSIYIMASNYIPVIDEFLNN